MTYCARHTERPRPAKMNQPRPPAGERQSYSLCGVRSSFVVVLAIQFVACGDGSDNPVTPQHRQPAAPIVPAPEPPAPPMWPRTTADQPDDVSGPQVHAVYAIASDGEDLGLDTDGTIRAMVTNMQAFLVARIPQRFRLDTHRGDLDVTFLRLGATEEELLLFRESGDPVVDVAQVAVLLEEAIERESEKIYAVFYTFDYEGRSITGSARLEKDVAGTYISHRSLARFADPLWQRIFETTMIHEVFHLMGAVGTCSPNQGRGRHVIDHDLDVMISGSSRPQWEWTHIDWGNDDYYGHGRADCVDIALSPYFEPA